MPTSTSRFAFQKPTVGGDADTWGGAAGLNGNLDEMDALFAAIATTGSANAYVLTSGLSLPAYATGQVFRIIPNFSNSGAATINVDGLGAKNLTKQGATALASGDLTSGRVYTIAYDGTQFQVLELVGLGTVQPLDATLTALAGLSTSADQYIRATGADTFAMSTVTAAAQALLADASVPRLGVQNTFSFNGPQIFNATSGATHLKMQTSGTDRGSIGADATYALRAYNGVGTELFRLTHSNGLAELLFDVTVSGSTRSRVRGLTNTTGTFTSADANCMGTLTGNVTINSGILNVTSGASDAIVCLAGGANRTLTRGTITNMYLFGTNVASATLPANTQGSIVAQDANSVVLQGAWQ